MDQKGIPIGDDKGIDKMEKDIEEKREKAYWSIQTWICLLTITIYMITWNVIILFIGWAIFIFNAVIKNKKDRENNQNQELDHELEYKKE